MAYNYKTTLQRGEKIPPDVTKFLQTYRATARLGEVRQQYRAMPFDYKSFRNDDAYASFHTETFYQQMVDVSLTEEDLTKLISDVSEVQDLERQYGPNIMEFIRHAHEADAQRRYEQRARQNNPGVKLAWEKYQMMLKIAGE